MYDKSGKTVVDRREQLRVKIKSLAEEARIIRMEEKRTHGVLRDELHLHRVGIVRNEARHAHLAYGFIRGRAHEQMEKNKPPFDQKKVQYMVEKYGPKVTILVSLSAVVAAAKVDAIA